MNPFEMVVAIIIVVTVGQVLRTRFKARHGIYEDKKGNDVRISDPDAARLNDEVHNLKQRIQVLERVITDERQSRDLDREIERLRNE